MPKSNTTETTKLTAGNLSNVKSGMLRSVIFSLKPGPLSKREALAELLDRAYWEGRRDERLSGDGSAGLAADDEYAAFEQVA